ncbi:kinase-like domain-containing protein [Rhizophagus diaphanus]|nr:kinase-like domain-containing protein [Rhizophagus diaphanus] [Rhizophagus sp. MUCL 43196]
MYFFCVYLIYLFIYFMSSRKLPNKWVKPDIFYPDIYPDKTASLVALKNLKEVALRNSKEVTPKNLKKTVSRNLKSMIDLGILIGIGLNIEILLILIILKFGKSENTVLDNFIFERNLKWIPYDKFENVKYLDKGGFGTIFKASWFYNNKDNEVILKLSNNLSENLNEFLNEWKYHDICLSSYDIIYFYGFTKDPDTLKYMMVMDYANKGLNDMHKKELIHCDFHDGNILYHNESKIYISDLGLCKPAKSFLKKYDIYGVIPFMAPEVLRGKSYTPASDIYSFSMIMWEFTSGIPPFNNRPHNIQLSLSICEGERPEIVENTPQCYLKLII